MVCHLRMEECPMYIKYKTIPENTPNEGILYVDHQKNKRSGHLSHALVEYKKGHIMSFYSNCSGTRNGGHNGFGWLEYKRSKDNGKSWDEAKVFPYSWDSLINQPFTVSCEKAVSTKDNEIIALCTRCTNPNGWEPYIEPTVVTSYDGGETWGEPSLLCDKCGRIYDALVDNGIIYVLFHAAADFAAKTPEEKYYIYKSDNGGKSFSLQSELPINPVKHGYGNMTLRDDGSLICYTYNLLDEYNLDYCISSDLGLSWKECGKSFCEKRIRNPQVAKTKNGFLLHGRSGSESDELPYYFVLYTSLDGINWDEGTYLCELSGFRAYYSNNIVLDLKDGKQEVLIQSSIHYDKDKVNISHWFIEIE